MSANLVIIGTQWGDEGKGKIVDFLARDCAMVVRFQGGNNAGHTVVLGDQTYKLHLIPSGILYADKMCVLGNGMVIDPAVLLDEIKDLKSKGHFLRNLHISERAHVIMPYHKYFDELEEEMKGADKIGTTMRGIGPCYSDKVARMGIRMSELLNANIFMKRLQQIVPFKQKILNAFGKKRELVIAEIAAAYGQHAEQLRHYVCDTTTLLNRFVGEGKKILFEGAQGTLLGIDHGTYPFVTGSETTAGNASCGSGVAPCHIGKVVGVVKAYSTRVGSGYFVSELNNALGEQLRKQGHEYGTTTGRPRRCGWLDIVALKYAVMVNGLSELAVTKLDVLRNIDPLQICVGYTYRDKAVDHLPADMEMLQEIQPVYQNFPGWHEDISNCRAFAELPLTCQSYIQTMEKLLGLPVRIISVGAERNQTIVRA
jgi:adenylosuccinate synthase